MLVSNYFCVLQYIFSLSFVDHLRYFTHIINIIYPPKEGIHISCLLVSLLYATALILK